jgi:spore coat protein A
MDRKKFIFNRRQFLKTTAGAAALLAARRRAYAFYQSPGLRKFIQPLRHYLNGGLTLAATDNPGYQQSGATHYTINVGKYTDQLHPALNPTHLFGYFQGAPSNGKHLGMTILAAKGTPVQITFKNQLPATHIIPVDTDPFFYNAAVAQNAIATHLHGGLVPWISDGGPYDWFTPDAAGPSFKNNSTLTPGSDPIWGSLPAGSGEYYYPNNQSARLLWYHDHAHDITRINAYAGIASAYVIRDPFENDLNTRGVLPSLANVAEMPLVFQDKVFVNPANILARDPTWPLPVDNNFSDLWYPHKYEGNPTASQLLTAIGTDTGRWDNAGPSPFGTISAPPDPTVIPEMFGDTILVNGTVYPALIVESRRYRFRVLNACNARFMNLQLYEMTNAPDGIALAPVGAEIDPNGDPVLAPTNPAGPAIYQIGTEAGFLPAPVVLNSPPRPIGYQSAAAPYSTVGNVNRYNLLLAPGERADVVIDFVGKAGKTYVLYSDTPAPFPGGDIRNDYYFGMTDLTQIGGSAGPAAGYGPNTRTLLQISVVPGAVDTVPTATWLSQIKTALASRAAELAAPSQVGAFKRQLSLNETFDLNGRLIQMMGTNVALYTTPAAGATPAAPFFGQFLEDPTTELVQAGATEVWEIYNNTADSHPIHFHLVNVQIVSRQPFDPNQFPNIVFTGPSRLPDANERGWKETVRMNPGEVTRVVMRFDLPAGLPFAQPTSDRSTLGLDPPPKGKIYHEYVYHCHILEHEEHDMMRPLIVVGPPKP